MSTRPTGISAHDGSHSTIPTCEYGPCFSATIMRLQGYIDQTNADRLRLELRTIHADGHRRLILHLGGVEYMSSIGWTVTTEAERIFRQSQGALKLCAMSAGLVATFRQLNYSQLLTACSTIDECLDALRTELIETLEKDAAPGAGVLLAPTEFLPDSTIVLSPLFPGMAALPLQEKITRILATHGPITIRQIRSHLAREEFGSMRMGVLGLRAVLKEMGLETRAKRIRYYVSR